LAAAVGGGIVVVPQGIWRTGTLVLKSFVTLHLDPGSTLSGSTDLKDYPRYIPALRSYVDRQVFRSLIYSEGAEHIAITGSGTIDGNGASFP
jgi:polygalacturonase